jgi:hypothetical protein
MLSSLRNRLILSHILPMLIIIPLMGIAIIYVFETRYILPNLGKELVGEAKLLAEITRQQDEIWKDARLAQDILNQSQLDPRQRVMLIKPDGRLLASSDPEAANRIDQPINSAGLSKAQNGELVTHIDYSQGMQGKS